MKILEIISGRSVNGAMVHCELLARRLASRGHQVAVVCRHTSWLFPRLADAGVERFGSTLAKWPPAELLRLLRWIRLRGFDVIHTHMTRGHNFGVMLKWLTGIPCVATAHARYVQLHWRFNTRIIANSEYTRRFHCRFNRIDPERIATVPCFIDFARLAAVNPARRAWIRRELGVAPDQLLVGVIGEVIPRKGQLWAAKALPLLKQLDSRAQLLVIGRFHRREAYSRQIRHWQLQSRLARQVRWLGRRDNVPDYLAALDMCLVPSLEEPQGLVALEAMAVGTPVVVSRTGGLAESVIDGETGLCVPPRDPVALAEAVVRLKRDEALGRRIVANARDWVYARYDPERLTSCIEDQLALAQREHTMPRARAG